jgi:putative acetyltransferase
LESLSKIKLFCAKEDDSPLGFIGIKENKIEMLFVAPNRIRQGIGSCLASFAITSLGAKFVDITEQNRSAILFYEHMGFQTFDRLAYDSFGKAFLVLHMRFKS